MATAKKDYVTVSDFSYEIQNILSQYGDEVQAIVDEEIVDVSKETVKKLKVESPKNTGKYRKGWKMKKQTSRFGIQTIVYNATHYWLVHILEHGYFSHKTHTRVNGQPHVGPAQKWAEKELLKRLKDKL